MGRRVTLDCFAEGHPTPEIYWNKEKEDKIVSAFASIVAIGIAVVSIVCINNINIIIDNIIIIILFFFLFHFFVTMLRA